MLEKSGGEVRDDRVEHQESGRRRPDAGVVEALDHAVFDEIRDAARVDAAPRDRLVAGKVDALVHDAPYIRAWPLIHPSLAARFAPLLKPVTDEPIAIAIRQGDPEFLRFLDVYVHEIRQDGTVAALFRRHFLDGEWAKTANLPKDTEKGGAE